MGNHALARIAVAEKQLAKKVLVQLGAHREVPVVQLPDKGVFIAGLLLHLFEEISDHILRTHVVLLLNLGAPEDVARGSRHYVLEAAATICCLIIG